MGRTKSNHTRRALPTGPTGLLVPIACAASSMMGKAVLRRDRDNAASMSQACPNRWTGKIARVRFVTAAATCSTSMLNVSGRMSTNTGVAPTRAMHPAVAKNVNGVVITSSPGPIPSAIKATIKRVRAARHADRVLRPDVVGHLALERDHLRTENVTCRNE